MLALLRDADAVTRLRAQGYQVTGFTALIPPIVTTGSETPTSSLAGMYFSKLMEKIMSYCFLSFLVESGGMPAASVVAGIVVGVVIVVVVMVIAMLVIAAFIMKTKRE